MSDATPAEDQRCGYVALVGRPNVGKSTLLNRLVGQKVSITSSRPQTTRHSILGIHTEGADQIVYVDTPGMHSTGKRALNRMMNRSARAVLGDVEVVAMLIEAGRWTDEDERVLERVRNVDAARFLLVNKTDRVHPRERLLPFLAACAKRASFDEIVPISALKSDNLERLQTLFAARLPQGPHIFAEDQYTDRSVRFLICEIVREKIMRRVGDELPHQITVVIDRYLQESDGLTVDASILVERRGQRAIVVGAGGERLKEAGIAARRDIEALVDQHVRLQLWVKVRSGWSDSDGMLKQLGFDH